MFNTTDILIIILPFTVGFGTCHMYFKYTENQRIKMYNEIYNKIYNEIYNEIYDEKNIFDALPWKTRTLQ